MLFRSTGLGKAELIAEIVDIRCQGDYLIMEMRTTEPVWWKIRTGLSRGDIRRILRATFKYSVLPFLLNPLAWFRQAAHPGDF